ncbi:MAG: hypothetical protein U0800_06055 [Isosphaeraceae bacterium]
MSLFFSLPAMPFGFPEDPAESAMLIVVPSRFAEALGPYVEFKKAIRPTELVTLEDALRQGQGGDDPEKLKRFLYDARRPRKIGYGLARATPIACPSAKAPPRDAAGLRHAAPTRAYLEGMSTSPAPTAVRRLERPQGRVPCRLLRRGPRREEQDDRDRLRRSTTRRCRRDAGRLATWTSW